MREREQKKGLAPNRRGPFALLALAIAALLVALWMWRGTESASWSSTEEPESGEPESEAERESLERQTEERRRQAARRAAVPDGGRPEPVHPDEPPPQIADPQIPGPGAEPEVADPGPGAEFIARYHGRSGRLSPHASVNGTQTSVPQRSRMAAPNVVVWLESRIGIPDEPLVIHAGVVGLQQEPVTPDRIAVTLFRDAPEDGVEIPMQQTESDYQASYTPTREAHPMGEGGTPARVQVLVRATGTYEMEDYSRSVTAWFDVSVPGAHMDFDRARVEREGSDLVMRVPVHIVQPGSYYGYAELWGGEEGGQPIAFARERVALVMGDQTFTFLFGGAVIRESGVDGPYTIRNARFMGVDTLPPHEQRPVEVVATTPGWSASSFE